MIRVLLVDDHPVVRAGYARLLIQDEAIEVVAEAGNVDEAYQAYVLHSPDITITDVSMPGVGGLGLVQKIRLRYPLAKLLVCSMYDSPQLIERVFQTGARCMRAGRSTANQRFNRRGRKTCKKKRIAWQA